MPFYLVDPISDESGTRPNLPDTMKIEWVGNVAGKYMICTETDLTGWAHAEEISLEKARRFMRNDLGLPERDLENGWAIRGIKAVEIKIKKQGAG